MVLNLDDSARTNSGKMELSGLMCNQDGAFQFDFYGSVGLFNIRRTEIHTLLMDIRLC